MHFSYCLLALSASYGTLAAPRTHDHAFANSGATDLFKRTNHGQQMDGLPSGMCMCPCAQGQDDKQDLTKDAGKDGGDSGEYNKGSDDNYEGEYEKEAGKYIKEKYMKLMKKNEKYDQEKKKKRQEYAMGKYSGNAVIIELVHVVIEKGNGNEKKHYAMSKWVVDGGKAQTKTCLMTAAETMTLGAGSCDDAASYAGPDKYQKEKEDGKKMDGQKEYSDDGAYNPSPYDAGAATPSSYVATSTYPDGTSTYSYTTSTSYASSTYYASSSTYSDAGAYAPSASPVYQGEGDKGEDVKDKEMKDKEIKDKEMKDKEIKDKEMTDKEMKDKEMKDKEMKDKEMKDQGMKDQGMKDQGMKDKEEKDKGMPKDNPSSTQADSQKSSSSSSMSAPKKSEDGKPMYVARRQIGGTVGMMMAPFIGMNDTIIMPDSVGAPQPQPGVELVEDPAKDVGMDGWSSACGI